NIGPKIVKFWTCKGKILSTNENANVGIILMEKLDGTLSDYIDTHNNYDVLRAKTQIINLIKRMNSLGYVHNDINSGNIMYKNSKNPKWYLIDFGGSEKITKEKKQY